MNRAVAALVLPLLIGATGCAALLQGGTVNLDVAKTTENMINNREAIKKAAPEAIAKITARDEVAIGQGASVSVIAAYEGLVDDADLTRYVNHVANLVAQHSHRMEVNGKPRMTSRRFFVGVLKDKSMGAFSLPGGYIYVTRGLLEKLGSESELAFVLGHEIAHVDREHNLETLKNRIGRAAKLSAISKNLAVTGTGAGEALALSFDDPKFFETVVGELDEIVGHTPEPAQESEADRIGLEAAISAGYDAHAAERVIDLLATKGTEKGYDAPDVRKKKLLEPIEKAAPGFVGAKRFDTDGMRHLEAAGS